MLSGLSSFRFVFLFNFFNSCSWQIFILNCYLIFLFSFGKNSEFYYIQMEKYARQAVSEGVKSPDELHISGDSEIYRVLNLHYNRNNHIEVSLQLMLFGQRKINWTIWIVLNIVSLSATIQNLNIKYMYWYPPTHRYPIDSVKLLNKHYANFTVQSKAVKTRSNRGRNQFTRSFHGWMIQFQNILNLQIFWSNLNKMRSFW